MFVVPEAKRSSVKHVARALYQEGCLHQRFVRKKTLAGFIG